MKPSSLRIRIAATSMRMHFSSLLLVLACLFLPAAARAQGSDAQTRPATPLRVVDPITSGQAATPAFDFAGCTSMAVNRITSAPDEDVLTTLPGNVHPLARAEFDRGAVPDYLPMEHIIMLLQRTPEQEAALEARIDQMHNRHSALFHQWLSPQSVGSCYGVSDADIAAISKWLQSKGFNIDSLPAGKNLLIFSGTAGQVRDAFHTEIHYLNVDGKQHIANMSAPQIPAALAPVVAGFRSLHDFFPKPTMQFAGLAKRDPETGKAYLVNGSAGSPFLNGGAKSPFPSAKASGPKGAPDVTYSAEGYYFVGPQDFYTIYNENPLLTGTSCSGAACNGSGQTIAVIEETDVCNGQTGTSPDNCDGANDLASFRSQFGLPTASVNYFFGISAGSYCSDPGVQGPNGSGEEGEADLDLQWAGAVAPAATVDYIACASTGTTAGVDLAASYAVNNLASTISSFSVSYGLCESVLPTEGFGANSFYNALWEQAAAQGQTVVISAGDSGDDVCDRGKEGATSGWNVNGLGSTPFNVATGGTDFTDSYTNGEGGVAGAPPYSNYWNTNDTSPYGSALAYVPETTWNQTCGSTLLDSYLSALNSATYTPEQVCNGNGGSPYGTDFTTVNGSGGGGISSIYSKPTWQSVYGVGLGTNYSSSTMRNLPDVSMFASSGFWGHALLYCESDATTGTGNGTPCDYASESDATAMAAGGTSFVSPQINGLMAVINQAHPSGTPAQPTRQGQADYTLYALATHEYGTTSAENTSTTAPSVLTCESDYLSISAYSSVVPSCVFHNINRTPVIETSTCTGTDNTSCVVDGNVMPCVTGDTDCYTATSGDAYGLLSISTSTSEPAWHQSAGYSDAVGLGSLNITNLVNDWTSSTWITQFASSTALATSSGSISSSGSVTLTATVTATGRGGTVSPAGIVEFFIGSTSGTLLGHGAIVQTCTGTGTSTSCDGVATLMVAGSSLNTGSNSIIAYFEGDGANDAPSTSPAVNVTVTSSSKITPTVTVTPAYSSINSAQSDQVTVIVSGGNGNPTPTGTVTLSSGTYTSAATTLASGSASITVPAGALAVGSDTLTATYSGDSNYNTATGTAPVTVSQAIGTCTTSSPNPNPNPESFAAVDDFDGNCKSDVLWQNTGSGEVYTWLMNGTSIASQASPETVAPSSDWVIEGVGDFNGDGKADVLWQNSSSGEVYLWFMNGSAISSQAAVAYLAPSTGWVIKGVGDFNGDGKADILWQNSSSGAVYIWFMNGSTITSEVDVATVAPSTDWVIKGVGDFNGDGKADILWQNSSSGEVYIWLMNGSTITSQASPETLAPSTDWVIEGVGDFNADGKSDILWQNSSNGEVYIWLMNGTTITSQASPETVAPSSGWVMQSVGDYDGSGRAGILWRNSSSGEVYMWLMNGTTITSQADVETIAPSAGWQIFPLLYP